MSLPARKLANQLVFTALTTSESARQAIAWDSALNVAMTGDDILLLVLRSLRIERAGGTGNIAVTFRFYGAASSDEALLVLNVPLTASGAGSRALLPRPGTSAPQSLDLYSESGLWVTAEASVGSGHTVKLDAVIGKRTAA